DGDVFALGENGPRVRVELSEGGTLHVDPALVPIPRAPAEKVAAAPAAGPDSRVRITFLSGTRAGSALDLTGSVVRIGRAEGSTIGTPADRVVSAQHAKIVRLDEGHVLIDLESTNGTYLNGRRVERAPLRDGDVIGLGPGGPELKVEVLAPARPLSPSAETVVIPQFASLAGERTTGVVVQEITVPAAGLVVGRREEGRLRLDSPIV